MTLVNSEMFSQVLSQPALSQIPSLEIRRSTLKNFIKFADLLISRLQNCESTGRAIVTT